MTNPANLKISLDERRRAIESTIQFLTEKPQAYKFMAAQVPAPDECGCALAWLGYFSGMQEGTSFMTVAKRLGLPSDLAEVMAEREKYYDEAVRAGVLPPWLDVGKVISWLKSLLKEV